VRVVVHDGEGASIGRHTLDQPLGTPSINGSISVLFLDDSGHVICVQVAFVAPSDCVDRPNESNDPRIAGTPASA